MLSDLDIAQAAEIKHIKTNLDQFLPVWTSLNKFGLDTTSLF